MKFPTSHIKEVQNRIDRAYEIFETLGEDTIFWLKWQHACTLAAKERNQNTSFKAKNEGFKIVGK